MSVSREALWPVMMEMDGEEIELEVTRETVQPGRTLSAAAMEQLNDEFIVWVGTRLARRWDETGEPPTALRVELRVIVG